MEGTTVNDDLEEFGEPIHIPEFVGWGCLLVVALAVFALRGCI